MSMERLQKIIAAAGIASRRKAEELITSGRVSINGAVVSELGTKADVAADDIRVDGKEIRGPERPIYLMLNKPKGFVTTVSDPEGRPTVMNLVKSVGTRVYPVGRLDYASEGLLLLTNDGALAQRLMHASSHVPKKYLVKISGRPKEEDIERLRHGVALRPSARPASAGRRKFPEQPITTAPAKIEMIHDAPNPWYEVTLVEGRNRQLHRMFDEIGHRVEKIKRVAYGPLLLSVEPGHFRQLTTIEVAKLKSAAAKKIAKKENDTRTSEAPAISNGRRSLARGNARVNANRNGTGRPPRQSGSRKFRKTSRKNPGTNK